MIILHVPIWKHAYNGMLGVKQRQSQTVTWHLVAVQTRSNSAVAIIYLVCNMGIVIKLQWYK